MSNYGKWGEQRRGLLLSLRGFEIRGEHLRSFIAGIGGPLVLAGKEEDLFPVAQGGDDFEGLGDFAGLVAREQLADSINSVALG